MFIQIAMYAPCFYLVPMAKDFLAAVCTFSIINGSVLNISNNVSNILISYLETTVHILIARKVIVKVSNGRRSQVADGHLGRT